MQKRSRAWRWLKTRTSLHAQPDLSSKDRDHGSSNEGSKTSSFAFTPEYKHTKIRSSSFWVVRRKRFASRSRPIHWQLPIYNNRVNDQKFNHRLALYRIFFQGDHQKKSNDPPNTSPSYLILQWAMLSKPCSRTQGFDLSFFVQSIKLLTRY